VGAADLLLSGLRALQRAKLTVGATAEELAAEKAADGPSFWPGYVTWRPAAQLVSVRPCLDLGCTRGGTARGQAASIKLDLGALGAGLKQLHLAGAFLDVGPVCWLVALESLSVLLPGDCVWIDTGSKLGRSLACGSWGGWTRRAGGCWRPCRASARCSWGRWRWAPRALQRQP
jgi:hypothetical protein